MTSGRKDAQFIEERDRESATTLATAEAALNVMREALERISAPVGTRKLCLVCAEPASGCDARLDPDTYPGRIARRALDQANHTAPQR